MKTAFVGGLVAAMLLVCGAVRADTAPPESAPCIQKEAGAACTYGGRDGTCTDTTCTKADLSSWDRDASPTPPTIQYACRLCITGAAPDAAADGPAGGDDGACAVGGRTASRVGPWLLAGAFSGLLLVARRRRRKAR